MYIKVFTIEGDIISKYSFRTKRGVYLLSPRGVAVDKDGNIYTCDYFWGKKIFVLTHDDECSHYYFALQATSHISMAVYYFRF